MKSAKKMLRDRIVIKDAGFFGAHISISESIAVELMKKYAKKYHKNKLKHEGN